jgi:hypothetical protein
MSIVSSICDQFDASGVNVQPKTGLNAWNTSEPTINRINTIAKGIPIASFVIDLRGFLERLLSSRQSFFESARDVRFTLKLIYLSRLWDPPPISFSWRFFAFGEPFRAP